MADVARSGGSERGEDDQTENEPAASKVVYIHSDELLQWCDTGRKVPQRASMVHSLIKAYGLLRFMRVVSPAKATAEELQTFHSCDYVEFLRHINDLEDEEKYTEEAEQYGLSYDCPAQVGVCDYARHVAGATIRAAQCIMENLCDVAINWCGGWHHAKRDAASGFCYINDIVLGILELRKKYNRILYIDLDLHHGDGVEEAFSATSKALTISFHKYSPGFFPGTGGIKDKGLGKGKYYCVNVPLCDGIRDAEFVAIFKRILCKVWEVYKPEVAVCQCGADGLAGDPMDSFNLTENGLARCVHFLKGLGVPLLLLGGGGYNFSNTSRCWTYITGVVLGRKLPEEIPDHEFYMSYGPDYELSVTAGYRKDHNTYEYLRCVYKQIIENLSHIADD